MTTHKHYETAKPAYYWTSFSPDRRAESECRYYDEICEEFKDSPEVLAKFERLFLASLSAKSRCASSAITGGSGFNVRRAKKANNAEHNRSVELSEFIDKCRSRRDRPESTAIKASDENAIEALTAKLEKLQARQDMMKAANKLLRAKPVDMAALAELLGSEAVAKALLEPDFTGRNGFASFQLTNNNAMIKATQERIASLEKMKAKPTTEREHEGIRIVENTEAARLQLFFDGKPAAEMITKLKSHGFKWAPSQGAWQRQLTGNALYSLRLLLEA
jgi:hypothetical protein